MARYIEQGKSIFIPFDNGVSITDSQLHLRMYKTEEMFKRYFPPNTKYDVLCEYAPVVRCKGCKNCSLCYPEKQIDKDATPGWYCKKHKGYRRPDDFCSYGERREGE